MDKQFRYKDYSNIPESARISAKKRVDSIKAFLQDPYLLNSAAVPWSKEDDHIRHLAKKIKDEKNFVLRSFFENLLEKPETAVEYYEFSEPLPEWLRKVLYDFVIINKGRLKLND